MSTRIQPLELDTSSWTVACACNPSTRTAETEGFLGLQASQLYQTGKLQPSERPGLKNQDGQLLRNDTETDLSYSA